MTETHTQNSPGISAGIRPVPGRKSPARTEGGFSLAEVLVAVALLSVILLALFGLITAGIQRAYGGKKMTQAAVLAESALNRANVQEAYLLLGAASTASSVTQSWTKTTTRTGAAAETATLPAASTATTAEAKARNAWRILLRDADLPASASHPATLTVTMTAMPATRTFANASMVNIVVDLSWKEYGTRARTVRLQTLNLRVVPS